MDENRLLLESSKRKNEIFLSMLPLFWSIDVDSFESVQLSRSLIQHFPQWPAPTVAFFCDVKFRVLGAGHGFWKRFNDLTLLNGLDYVRWIFRPFFDWISPRSIFPESQFSLERLRPWWLSVFELLESLKLNTCHIYFIEVWALRNQNTAAWKPNHGHLISEPNLILHNYRYGAEIKQNISQRISSSDLIVIKSDWFQIYLYLSDDNKSEDDLFLSIQITAHTSFFCYCLQT